jgi:two-component system chemotaxis response regulator CheB
MPSHPIDIVAIGASAGGIEALSKLLHELPADLPATILVTLHRSPDYKNHLQSVLTRAGHRPVIFAKDGEKLQTRKCYLGRPSQHLTVGPGLVAHLVHDGFYRGHNIDLLFNSLARNAGSRTVGVVLSGMMKDGAQGLRAVKEAGGKALVQSPSEAGYEEMPRSAINFDGPLDMVAPVHDLAQEISRLVHMKGPILASSETPPVAAASS